MLVIDKATTTISLAGLSQTYDGSPKPVTATTTPSGLTLAVTYDTSPTAPTNAGSYAVSAAVNDSNYQGSATGMLVIAPGNDWTAWSEDLFTEAEAAAGLAAEDGDPDADGLTNLAEYALGMNPHQFSPPFLVTKDANGLTLVFTRPANLPDVSYAAECSDGLGTWSPALLEVLTSGATETMRARDPLTSGNPSKRFLRLRFQRQ